MPWDPESGQWSPDVSRQPLGMLGAAMNFWNASRARGISGDRDEARRIAIETAQQQQDQDRRDAELEQSAREAISGMTDSDEIATTITKFAPMKGMPFLRAKQTAEAKRDVAGITSQGRVDVANINQGVTGAPKPLAEAAAATSKAGLQDTQAGDIVATQKSRIELNEAKAELARTTGQMRLKMKRGGQIGPREASMISARIIAAERTLSLVQNQKDPLTGMSKKLTPEDEDTIAEIQYQIQEQKSLLSIAKSSVTTGTQAPTGSSSSTLSPAAAALMPPG